MAVDEHGNEIAESTNEVVDPNKAIADTVVVQDVTTNNEDLDAKLEALAGRKPNEAPQADPKTKVPAKSADDSNDKTAQPQKAPATPEQRPIGDGRRAPITPRAYPKAYRVDANNNVVDAATGAVIAPAGSARAAFERHMLPYIEGIRAEAEKYKTEAEAYKSANTAAASLGLTPDQYLLGGKIMKAWVANPKEALRFLLTEAQNNDIDVSDIVAGGGGPSMSAIVDAITKKFDEKLQRFLPFAEEREQQLQERERTEVARNNVEALLAEHPDAELHGLHIASIMNHHANQGQEITMREAYLLLKNHALQNGLDWTKDLREQVLAKTKQPNGSTTTAPNVDTRRALPNFNGRESNPAIIPRPTGKANGLADSGDIVREAMREAGIPVP